MKDIEERIVQSYNKAIDNLGKLRRKERRFLKSALERNEFEILEKYGFNCHDSTHCEGAKEYLEQMYAQEEAMHQKRVKQMKKITKKIAQGGILTAALGLSLYGVRCKYHDYAFKEKVEALQELNEETHSLSNGDKVLVTYEKDGDRPDNDLLTLVVQLTNSQKNYRFRENDADGFFWQGWPSSFEMCELNHCVDYEVTDEVKTSFRNIVNDLYSNALKAKRDARNQMYQDIELRFTPPAEKRELP